MPRLFALDQNFPLPIVAALQKYILEARLCSLAAIDPRLTANMDDWEILPALHHHPEPWDGLITTDSSILNLPRELAVLMQTKLTLVVAEAAGHDSIKATGLVPAHLPWICDRTRRDVSQIWRLATRPRPHDDPWDRFADVANHLNRTTRDLYDEQKLSDGELATDPLRGPD